jgi:hypothetical protein
MLVGKAVPAVPEQYDTDAAREESERDEPPSWRRSQAAPRHGLGGSQARLAAVWQQNHLGWARYEELKDAHIQSHTRAAVRRGYQSAPDLIQP